MDEVGERMRVVLFVVLLAFAWIFLMENDQEHVNITFPGSGQIGPFSIGIVILGSVLFGILLCSLMGGMMRMTSKFRKMKSKGGGDPHSGPNSDQQHDSH